MATPGPSAAAAGRRREPAGPGAGDRGSQRRRLARIVPTDEGHGVTTLELFFDLVFVFAITQVTAFMADDLGWRGLLRGLVLLSLLWFAWCSYAWLGNQAHADEAWSGRAIIVAMAAMFLVALAIPEAWGDEGGGISAPVRARRSRWPWCASCTWPSTRVAAARRRRAAPAAAAAPRVPVGASAVLLVVGAVLGGPTQTVLWALALVVDYTGIYASGTTGGCPPPATSPSGTG